MQPRLTLRPQPTATKRAALALALVAFSALAAGAQTLPPPPAQPGSPPQGTAQPNNPAQAARAQTCARLEGQLAMIDRGGAQPDARGDQARQLETQIARQQGDLDRLSEQLRGLNCGGGFLGFNLGQSPQCGSVSTQIQRARTDLERSQSQLRQLQNGGAGEPAERRRAVLVALAQNECGPQYRVTANAQPAQRAAQPRQGGGFLESLFGGSATPPEESARDDLQVADVPPASTFRTLCVRTCDGFYFPISYATVPSRIANDEQKCQRLCPAAEAVLVSHRNPGEDVSAAVTAGGQSYRDLPNAFRFRQAFDPACTCKASGQSWAEAITEDDTVERGDVVVKEGDRHGSPAPRPPAAKPAQKPAASPQQQPRPAPKPQPRADAGPASPPPQAASAPLPPPGAPSGPRNVGTPYYR